MKRHLFTFAASISLMVGTSFGAEQNARAASAASKASVDSSKETSAKATDPALQAKLDAVDAMIKQRMAKFNLPGYVIAIIDNDKLVFQKPYGYANVDTKQPVTNDTVFGLASLTKTFTGMTLLSLVDKGLVGLDDPLSKYIPNLTPAYQPLTIRQLASMTAGVPSQLPQEVEWKNQLPILQQTPLVSEPGTKSLYSNYSYRLLGSVISNVTKQPYFSAVKQTIFAPLNMNNSGTTVLLKPGGQLAQAYGSEKGGGIRPVEYKNPEITQAAGMLASTSNDLVKYVRAMLAHDILSEQGYKTLMYTRPPLKGGQPCRWAFGWSSTESPKYSGRRTVAMNGGTPGVASTIIMFPEQHCAVIALCNLRKPASYTLARAAAQIMYGNEVAPEDEATPPAEDSTP